MVNFTNSGLRKCKTMPSKYHWKVGLPQNKVPYLWQELLHNPCHEYKINMATSSIRPGFEGPQVDSMCMPYCIDPFLLCVVTHEQATTILKKHAHQINSAQPYSKISTWMYTKWYPNLAEDAYRMYLIFTSEFFLEIFFYSKINEIHQFLKFILFWSSTLHVSVGLFAHHQESKTVHTTSCICQILLTAC
jgi:hypothetical protein